MPHLKLILALTCAPLTYYYAYAQQPAGISKVRQAAISKLQTKLGDIRGTIKQKDRNVYLTDMMIEQLKPIIPGQQVENLSYQNSDSIERPTPTSVSVKHSNDQIEHQVGSENTAEIPVEASEPDKNIVKEAEAITVQQVLRLEPSREIEEGKTETAIPQPGSLTRSERLQREIFKAVNTPLSNGAVDRTIVTNSTAKNTLPDTSDIEEILKAVDKMIGSQS